MYQSNRRMMKKQLLLINFALFLSLVCGQTQPPPICDPKTDRHCFDFEEHDVESTFDGVGEVVTPAPVENESDVPPATPLDGEPKDETISVPTTDRSSSSNSNNSDEGLHTVAIVGMALGGTLLLVGAAVMRRRKLNGANGSSDVSAIDSMQPSGDNTV